MIEPLRLSVEVACPSDHAFAVWTNRTSVWWPPSHTVTGDAAMVIEGRLGGRIYQRTASGDEVDCGEVTLWEPPRRFGYLWHMRTDREGGTNVEVTFVDQGASTRVEIEHTGWERLGERGPPWRERNRAGWDGLLPHFVEACAPR